MTPANDPYLVPDWPLPPGVAAVFSTRAGGLSAAPYGSLNLGDHVGDAPAAVAANRSRFAQRLGTHPVFLQQMHGTAVAALDAHSADGLQADGCVSRAPGVACTIMVADCLPVLFCHADGSTVAAAHAGWRGLAGQAGQGGQGGILAATLKAFSPATPAEYAYKAIKNIASQVSVWLGPCIGPQAFEVGSEVRAAFVAGNAQAASQFVPCGPGKYLCNLQGLARQQLAALGVERIYGNDGSAAWCTVGNPLRFFSHRRDAARLGSSGRMAAAIWRL